MMVNNPTMFNPYSHPDDARHRRDQVIDAMVANKVLDEQSAAAAKGAPLGALPNDPVVPSLKVTVPVGRPAVPLTVAVKVTLAPAVDGLADELSATPGLTRAALTTCVSAADVPGLYAALPE